MKQIEINSEAWSCLVDEIATGYNQGELISHEWLKKKFTLEKLKYESYETLDDFIQAIQMQQFAYMNLIDTLRWQLLEERQLFLRNIRGDGYTIMPSTDQAKYGYDEFLKTVKDAIRRADLIMSNILPLPMEQQVADNNLRARCSMLKQMISGLKS